MNVEPGVSVLYAYGRPEGRVVTAILEDFGGKPGSAGADAERVVFVVHVRKNERVVPQRVLSRSEFVLVFPGRDRRRSLLRSQMEELPPCHGANDSPARMIGQDRAHRAIHKERACLLVFARTKWFG